MGTKNLALNAAIFASGISAIVIAEKIGRSSGWLSKVRHGTLRPKPKDRKSLSKILNVKESEIFK